MSVKNHVVILEKLLFEALACSLKGYFACQVCLIHLWVCVCIWVLKRNNSLCAAFSRRSLTGSDTLPLCSSISVRQGS